MTQAQNMILVVEDEVLIRMSTVTILEDAGFGVLEAQDSAEALDMLASHHDIRLMVTDVRMPGDMDGLALVEKAQRDHPGLRSIVVSGNATALEASNAGALGFLPKPYMAQTMVQAVHDTMNRH